MPTTFIIRRCAAASAAFVLACGAAGVAASAALADTSPVPPVASASPTPSSSAEPTATPVAEDPMFTLTANGAGSFSLVITLAGTPITVDYTVDAKGWVTAASTSTAGVSVAGKHHDLTVAMADGHVVTVELGDAGDVVEEVTVDAPKKGKHDAAADDGDQPDPADAPEPQSSASTDTEQDNADEPGDEQPDEQGAPAIPGPQATTSHEQDEGDHADEGN